MSPADEISIHPSLKLIFPTEEIAQDGLSKDAHKENINPDAAWNYYSHKIRRNPTDLTLHTHRIFFAMQHKNAEMLPGSLNDLFFILKDAGKKLRIRLLKASLPYLSKQDTLYFAMWIKVGIKKGMGYQWVNGSVLSDGLFGPEQTLITMVKDNVESISSSPLEEAREYMDRGQLEIAQQVLLRALAADPDNTTLTEELEYLNDYVKSREIQPEENKPKTGLGRALGALKNKLFRKQ